MPQSHPLRAARGVRANPDAFPGMFDEHLNRQHRLSYVARGPEWAFAIPQGDLDALEWVMRRCSTFWNGVGTVLVPVGADGRIPASVKRFLQIRPVDACYTHERLGGDRPPRPFSDSPGQSRCGRGSTAGNSALPTFSGGERPCRPGSWSDLGSARPACAAPHSPSGATSRRRSSAAYWENRYEVVFREGEHAHGALLRGQVQGQAASPAPVHLALHAGGAPGGPARQTMHLDHRKPHVRQPGRLLELPRAVSCPRQRSGRHRHSA